MMVAETTGHIYKDEQGRAWIDDSRIKVIEVVLDALAYGWSADEIHEQHPHLTLAQIHAALAYYYDHQAELDEQIKRDLNLVRGIRQSTGQSPMQRRLWALNLVR